jgi:hypothetical protein
MDLSYSSKYQRPEKLNDHEHSNEYDCCFEENSTKYPGTFTELLLWTVGLLSTRRNIIKFNGGNIALLQTTSCSHVTDLCLNPLKTKRRLIYLKTLSVPRCKHFSPRL